MSVGFTHHPFPTYFGCGRNRPEGDGLWLFPDPIEGRHVASAWRLDTPARLHSMTTATSAPIEELGLLEESRERRGNPGD